MAVTLTQELFTNPTRQDDFFDDFNHMDLVGLWVDTSTDTGAAPTLATDGESAVVLTTGATNNNEAYLSSNRLWDVVADKPIVFETRLKYTESATDDANVAMGFCSAAAADAILDDGGGPAASYSGALFFKVDGGTAWQFETSVAGAQTTNTISNVTPGGGTYQSFRIEIRPIDSTTAEVVPLIDSSGGNNFVQCKDATTGNLIKHTITYTSYAAAEVMLGVKAGSASSETPRWDYVRVSQAK